MKDSELGDTEQERKAFLDKLGEETEYQNITSFTEKRVVAVAVMVFLLFKEMGVKEQRRLNLEL